MIGDPNNDVWVQDLERGALTRLTSGGNNVQPIWTPDGKRVVFAKNTGGVRTPFWVPADGSGEPERLFEDDHRGGVASFSPDGQLLTFNRRAPDTGLDLWVRPLNGTQAPHPFLRTRFTEVGAKFSPDGRWIAYVSDESGQYEVYVRPYPGPGGKWQVSTQGGGEIDLVAGRQRAFLSEREQVDGGRCESRAGVQGGNATSACLKDRTSTSGAYPSTWRRTAGGSCCSSPPSRRSGNTPQRGAELVRRGEAEGGPIAIAPRSLDPADASKRVTCGQATPGGCSSVVERQGQVGVRGQNCSRSGA